MTYIHKLSYDIKDKGVRKDLSNPDSIHKRLARMFDKRVLWRMEKDHILVQSDSAEIKEVDSGFMYKGCKKINTEYAVGDTRIFKIELNTVRGNESQKTVKDTQAFLEKKACVSVDDFYSTEVVITIKKGDMVFSSKRSIIVGVLKVRDDVVFKNAILNGIGRHKHLGCGMLSVMP